LFSKITIVRKIGQEIYVEKLTKNICDKIFFYFQIKCRSLISLFIVWIVSCLLIRVRENANEQYMNIGSDQPISSQFSQFQYLAKISIFVENYIFCRKFPFLSKILCFCRKFYVFAVNFLFLPKISFFAKNFIFEHLIFVSKISIFVIFFFDFKILIFGKNFHFCQTFKFCWLKFHFLVKISMFRRKSFHFLSF